MACLCAPTSHVGSFRCRLHRSPNPIVNPSNHPVDSCVNRSNSTCNRIGGIPYYATVCNTSASTAPMDPLVDENGRFFSHFPQVAADRQSGTCCIQSSLPLETFAGSSVASSLPKPLSYRQPPSTPSTSSQYTSSSSLPSPSRSFLASCARPPSGKRPGSSSPKCPYRSASSSPPVHPTSWCGSSAARSNFTMRPSHAAAMAIMKQHLSHGKRAQNRSTLSSTWASKIGPSRLSRMAEVHEDGLPTLEEENSISGLHQDNITESFGMPSGLASIGSAHRERSNLGAAHEIGRKMRSAVNKFKQSESLCRVVGSNKESLIMPTVY